MQLGLKVGAKHQPGWREILSDSASYDVGELAPAFKPEWYSSDEGVIKLTPAADGRTCLFEAVAEGVCQVQVSVTNAAGQVHKNSADVEVHAAA